MASTSSTTRHARYVEPKILWNEEELDLTGYVKSITYTDNASGTLDDIQIELSDRDYDWCGGWVPNKEDDLDVSLYLHNWYEWDKTLYYHCGNFTLDDITYSGNPRTLSIGAISEPADTGFKETKRTQVWRDVTLRDVANEIKDRYGMSTLYYNADEYTIESIEQSDQTDSDFLKSLCGSYGLSIKIYKKSIVIFDEEWYESGNAAFTIQPYLDSDHWVAVEPGWTWNSTLQGTYTGGAIYYTDSKKGKDIEVTIGTTERLLIISEKADSLADAELKIKAKVNEENKKAVTMDFTMTRFDHNMVASCCANLVGFDSRIDGKYYVDKVVNTYQANGGTTQKVTCHKVFARL